MTLGSLLQDFRHHCLVRQMWHVKSVQVRSKFVSVGFVVKSKSRRLSVRFCKEVVWGTWTCYIMIEIPPF